MGLGAKGNATTEALNRGVDLDDAVKRGDTDAMIEVGTEMMTGGLNIFGKGALDDLVQNGIVKKVENEVGRFLVQQGVNISGEVLEETVSDILGTILDKGTTDPDATYSWKDWGKTAVTTLLSTVALNLLTGGLVGDVRQAQNRNNLREQVNNSNLSETQKNNLSQKIQDERVTNQEELSNEVKKLNAIEKSGLDEDRQASLLRFADKNNLSVDQINDLVKADQERFGIEQKQGTTTQNETVLPQAQQTNQLPTKQAQNETSSEIEDKGLNLAKSIDNFNKSVGENEKIFDLNDEKTKKEIEGLQKIANEGNVSIEIDRTPFEKNGVKDTKTNAFYEYDKDGKLARVVLNPHTNTKKYVQNLVMHEMYHSFTNQNKEGKDLKLKDKLRNAIIDNAQRKAEFEDSINDLYNTYGKTYASQLLGKNVQDVEIIQERDGESYIGKVTFEDGTTQDLRKDKKFNNQMYDMIEEEAVANILGEKLGNQEFVEELVNGKYKAENKGLVEKIYDFVKNQINRFTGYKDQEQYWKHVKELFDNAYRNAEKNQGQSFSKEATAMTNITDSQGRNLSQGQVDYFKDSKVRDENGNLLEVYHGTPTRWIYNI